VASVSPMRKHCLAAGCYVPSPVACRNEVRLATKPSYGKLGSRLIVYIGHPDSMRNTGFVKLKRKKPKSPKATAQTHFACLRAATCVELALLIDFRFQVNGRVALEESMSTTY
jgi:hypothetical protein